MFCSASDPDGGLHWNNNLKTIISQEELNIEHESTSDPPRKHEQIINLNMELSEAVSTTELSPQCDNIDEEAINTHLVEPNTSHETVSSECSDDIDVVTISPGAEVVCGLLDESREDGQINSDSEIVYDDDNDDVDIISGNLESSHLGHVDPDPTSISEVQDMRHWINEKRRKKRLDDQNVTKKLKTLQDEPTVACVKDYVDEEDGMLYIRRVFSPQIHSDSTHSQDEYNDLAVSDDDQMDSGNFQETDHFDEDILNCAKKNTYSHHKKPKRKSELCKFFVLGNCIKNGHCYFLHSEFPCKYYYLGIEHDQDQCNLSHGAPLSAKMRNILLIHVEKAPQEILGDFQRLSYADAAKMFDNRHRELVLEYADKSDGGLNSDDDQNSACTSEYEYPIQGLETSKHKYSRTDSSSNLDSQDKFLTANLLRVAGVSMPEDICNKLKNIGVVTLEHIKLITVNELYTLDVNVGDVYKLLNTLYKTNRNIWSYRKTTPRFPTPSYGRIPVDYSDISCGSQQHAYESPDRTQSALSFEIEKPLEYNHITKNDDNKSILDTDCADLSEHFRHETKTIQKDDCGIPLTRNQSPETSSTKLNKEQDLQKFNDTSNISMQLERNCKEPCTPNEDYNHTSPNTANQGTVNSEEMSFLDVVPVDEVAGSHRIELNISAELTSTQIIPYNDNSFSYNKPLLPSDDNSINKKYTYEPHGMLPRGSLTDLFTSPKKIEQPEVIAEPSPNKDYINNSLGNMSFYGNTVSIKPIEPIEIPFEPILLTNYVAASEINAGYNPYEHIIYKLIEICIPSCDNDTIIQNVTARNVNILADPRLRRIMRKSSPDSSESSPKRMRHHSGILELGGSRILANSRPTLSPFVPPTMVISDPRRKPVDTPLNQSPQLPPTLPSKQYGQETLDRAAVHASSWYQELNSNHKIMVNQQMAIVSTQLQLFHSNAVPGKLFDFTYIQENSLLQQTFVVLGIFVDENGICQKVEKDPHEQAFVQPIERGSHSENISDTQSKVRAGYLDGNTQSSRDRAYNNNGRGFHGQSNFQSSYRSRNNNGGSWNNRRNMDHNRNMPERRPSTKPTDDNADNWDQPTKTSSQQSFGADKPDRSDRPNNPFQTKIVPQAAPAEEECWDDE